MHQAFYRKYRPLTFSDVCGQENITNVLRYEAKTGNISHAYLFHGSRGTGKTTCAKILARAVNCENPKDGDPCGECPSCIASASSECPDIVEMDAASNNGVDYIRDLREAVNFSASVLSRRVYIIDEVHMLSGAAFNALLKTLEEPPEGVVFILATTELQKIPATILSRCQRFDFHRIDTKTIIERLQFIAKEENIELEDDAAITIARLSYGGLRDAISLLELASGNGQKVTEDLVNEISGVFGRDKCHRVLSSILERDLGYLFEITAELYDRSLDVSAFCKDLISYIRDIIVMKSVSDADKYLDVTSSEKEELKEFKKTDINRLLYILDILQKAFIELSRNDSSSRVLFETALLRAATPENSFDPAAFGARIGALEQRVFSGSFTTSAKPAAEKPKTPPAEPPKPVEKAEKPAAESYVDFNDWVDVTNELSNMATSAIASNCEAFIDKGNKIIMIKANNPTAYKILSTESSVAEIKNALGIFDPSYAEYNLKISLSESDKKDPFNEL